MQISAPFFPKPLNLSEARRENVQVYRLWKVLQAQLQLVQAQERRMRKGTAVLLPSLPFQVEAEGKFEVARFQKALLLRAVLPAGAETIERKIRIIFYCCFSIK